MCSKADKKAFSHFYFALFDRTFKDKLSIELLNKNAVSFAIQNLIMIINYDLN